LRRAGAGLRRLPALPDLALRRGPSLRLVLVELRGLRLDRPRPPARSFIEARSTSRSSVTGGRRPRPPARSFIEARRTARSGRTTPADLALRRGPSLRLPEARGSDRSQLQADLALRRGPSLRPGRRPRRRARAAPTSPSGEVLH